MKKVTVMYESCDSLSAAEIKEHTAVLLLEDATAAKLQILKMPVEEQASNFVGQKLRGIVFYLEELANRYFTGACSIKSLTVEDANE